MAALTSAMGAASAASDIQVAKVLSPSQITSFTNCAFAWYAKSVLKLPDPMTGARAFGNAVHDAIAANFQLKVETGKDLPVQDVLMEFDAAWGAAEEQTEFREDEDPAAMAKQGRSLVELYMTEQAPKVQPLAVELPVSGEIGGVKVTGRIDLIDQNWIIQDIKTSARKSKGLSSAHRIQLATYAKLSPQPCQGVARSELVKTKTPQLVQIHDKITPEDNRFIENLFPIVQEAMKSGIYPPNRQGTMCSRKHCSYWRICEREFGGRVSGGEDEA